MVTKSGSNNFHGSLFEFVRNDMFDAKDFFNVPQAGNVAAGVKPAFHQNRLTQLIPLVTGETGRVLERLETAVAEGEAVDISKFMASLTLSITTKALFGVDLGDEVNNVGDVINMAADLLEKPKYARFQNALQYVDQVVFSIIEERRRTNVDNGDLISKLLQARDEETGQGMDDQQLRNQVITLLLAGYETTANALTWTWYLLAQNPEKAGQMRSEAAQVLSGSAPSSEDLTRLPYTRMVFEESLLDEDRVYEAQLRMRLDTAKLPK